MNREEILKSLAFNNRMLSLLNSPFPDGQELAKRQEIRKEIKQLEQKLKKTIIKNFKPSNYK